jgi:DNA polymerase elongation subunit (family B)
LRFYTFAKLYGDSILVRGYDDAKGGSYKEKVSFKPTLFLPSPKPTGYTTLDGRNVAPVQPGNPRDCRNFIEDYASVDGTAVYGFERYLYQYLSEAYDDEIEYDIDKIKLWSLDIETASENGFPKPELAEEEVLLITLKNYKTKRLITFGSRPYEPTRDDVEYVYCPREYDLLSNFVAWWESVEPEVITGWNVELFDMTYLCNRITRVLGEKQLKRLSPWGIVNSDFVESFGRRQQKYTLAGVSVLDYLDLYKKFTYTNRENYRLDTIANIELGQKKLDHSEFETFKDFYTHGWTKFVDYNLIDVDLVDRLEDKMKLIDLVLLMAYDAHCNYTDTFAQVRLWDILIYNYLRKQKIVLPLLNRSEKSDQYAGAYVKEPQPGGYDWVVSFDLNSLYPSLIRFLNISPETILDTKHPNADVEKMILKQVDLYDGEDACVAANGARYSKEKTGFMPLLVTKMYAERVQYKKQMLQEKQRLEEIEGRLRRNPTDELRERHAECVKSVTKWSNFQMVRKICLNSLYGAIGNQYFRHYRLDNAEAITLTGQVAIRWIERKMNEFLNKCLQSEEYDYVIASDTDSIYLNLGPLVRTVFGDGECDASRVVPVLNQFCEDKIVPYIDASYKELSDYLNCYEETLIMKRECIAERGIWTAKKRYILNVWDNEGVRYEEPKLKMMGIEAVKSSTPAPCRKYIADSLKILMSGTEDELIDYVAQIKTEFNALPVESIAFPRSANNLGKFADSGTIYRKSTPMHVRGSLLFNFLLKEKKILHKYNLIGDGEKIKFVYMKTPNPLSENVMAFITAFPPELGLIQFVDHDTMFIKGFLDPLQAILDVIGWRTEKVTTLDDFFS